MIKNRFKILLIHPPKVGNKTILDYLRYPPIGITTIASVLRNKGMKPFLFDANIEKDDSLTRVLELITREKINAIGLSFTSILAESAYYFADRIKELFPNQPIIAGGYHPTVLPDEVARHPSIDYVVVGEGEVTLPLLSKKYRKMVTL